MQLEWTSEDNETLAHVSKLNLENKETVFPQHAVSPRDLAAFEIHATAETPKHNIIIAGEVLTRTTFDRVGHDSKVTDWLTHRQKARTTKNATNFVYSRIPTSYGINGGRVGVYQIDELQASALVGVQLEADASAIIPPIPCGIQTKKVFDGVLERTVVELQTFKRPKEIIGYIPNTEYLELARDMVKAYLKKGIRLFGVDFSGASNAPSLMRTVVRAIREGLKIKNQAVEDVDKQYYLHVFNVATSKKSTNEITSISDLLTHMYGVDSTSGVMWGGGKMEVEKFRYYSTDDYGAYRMRVAIQHKFDCECPICSNQSLEEIYRETPPKVMEKLRVHRVSAYGVECQNITEKIGVGEPSDDYGAYLKNKKNAKNEVTKILRDVKEIKAAITS